MDLFSVTCCTLCTKAPRGSFWWMLMNAQADVISLHVCPMRSDCWAREVHDDVGFILVHISHVSAKRVLVGLVDSLICLIDQVQEATSGSHTWSSPCAPYEA